MSRHVRGFLFKRDKMETISDMQEKQFEAGSGIEFKKISDDKILISATTKTKFLVNGFTIEGKEIIIEGDKGIKISSRHPNVLVISMDITKVEEGLYDLKKEVDARLKTIEEIFLKIVRNTKNEKN